jgi:hypothetical protein
MELDNDVVGKLAFGFGMYKVRKIEPLECV